jgi:hypothetical protein
VVLHPLVIPGGTKINLATLGDEAARIFNRLQSSTPSLIKAVEALGHMVKDKSLTDETKEPVHRNKKATNGIGERG